MARKIWDPLAYIPSAQAVREKLEETQEIVRKLHVLLDVAERLERAGSKDEGAAGNTKEGRHK